MMIYNSGSIHVKSTRFWEHGCQFGDFFFMRSPNIEDSEAVRLIRHHEDSLVCVICAFVSEGKFRKSLFKFSPSNF